MANKIKELTRKLREDDETRSDYQLMLKDILSLVEMSALTSSNPKVAKAVSALGVGLSMASIGKNLYNLYKKQTVAKSYQVKVLETDDIYGVAEEWLMETMPEDEQLSVYAYSSVDHFQNDGSPSAVDINISFDGAVVQMVEVGGHPVQIYTHTPESATKQGNGKMATIRTIIFECETLAGRKAVLDELKSRSQNIARSQPSFYASRNWGGFQRTSSIKHRALNSVILKEGQAEQLMAHVRQFLDNEEAYIKTGIPYRTGIMLHGNPGSGKSSTALAVANELGLDVYFISISSVSDDETLQELFTSIPERTLLVLEDIDTARAVKDRDKDDSKGVTMAGMLNVLDGFVSPHGVVTIMTTNRIDVLDPAIIRPGRVDLQMEFNELDNYQLRGICEYFMGFVPENLPEITVEDGITSAQIVGVFKDYITDFPAAEDALVEFVSQKVLNFTK